MISHKSIPRKSIKVFPKIDHQKGGVRQPKLRPLCAEKKTFLRILDAAKV